MSLVSQLQLVMSRIGAEFKSVRTAVAAKADKTTTVTAGAGLSGGGDLSASRSLNVVYGTVVGTAAQGNDSRLSDARAPLGHDASLVVSGTLADARLPVRLGIYGATHTDWNEVRTNGIWMAAGAANAPSTDGAWWKGLVIVHNDLWVTQLVGNFTDVTNLQAWYMRHSQDSGGTRLWSGWQKVNLTQGSQDARYVQLTDTRLTDARTPTAHTHVKSQITDFAHTHNAASDLTGIMLDAQLPVRLGGNAANTNDWNFVTASGWYKGIGGVAVNGPDSAYTYLGDVISRDNGSTVIQTLHTVLQGTNTRLTYRRHMVQPNGWGPWEQIDQSVTELNTTYAPLADSTTTRDTTVRHVKMATTTNIILGGAQTIDGVPVTNNCRILVKNQTNAAQNGVYIGSTGVGSWVRATDLNTAIKWNNLAPSPVVHISVQEGTQAGTDWIAKFPNTGVLGTTDLTFSPVSGVSSSSIVRATEGVTNFAANTWYQITGLAVAGQQGGAISFAGGVYTINVTGWYRLSAQSFFTTYSAVRYIMRVVNGTNPDANILIADEDGGTGGALPVLTAAGTVYLTAGSTLRLYLYCTSATSSDAKALTVEAMDNPRVGTTPVLSDTGWLDLPMSAGWRSYAAGYDTPQYRKVGNTVHVKGFIAGGTTTIGTIVATLPSGYRPIDISHIVHTDANGAVARLNVYPDGTIRINSGWSNVWTTFGYISFPVDAAATGVALTDTGWLNMSLTGGMVWWGTGWQLPQYRKVGNLVRLRGLVNSGTTPTATFWQAPAGFFSPSGSSMWGTRMGDGSVRRTDLSALGAMSFPEGATASTFFPLEHMQWYTD